MSSRVPGLLALLAGGVAIAAATAAGANSTTLVSHLYHYPLQGNARQPYVSARYHYSLPVPAGLKLTPAKADQTYGLFPAAPSPEIDFFGTGPADNSKGIAVASVQLPAGTTLKKWEQTNLQAIAHQFSCHDPKQEATTLDGTPAVELVYAPSCYGDFDTIEVVHGGRGYDVYWLGPVATRSQDQARFHADIKAFRFTS